MIDVTIKHASGVKCLRCYHWSMSMLYDNICNRCAAILEKYYPSHEASVKICEELLLRGLSPQDNPQWNNV